jgi:hypothetical protein
MIKVAVISTGNSAPEQGSVNRRLGFIQSNSEARKPGEKGSLHGFVASKFEPELGVSAKGSVLRPFEPEESLQQIAAFAFQHAVGDFEMMVHPR